jgi:hypothetical protein
MERITYAEPIIGGASPRKELVWDKKNSTFHWLIALDEEHESYAYKGTSKFGAIILDGYSGTIGFNERSNKQELLLKNVIFLTKKYSEKSKNIRIFLKAGEEIDKNIDPCLIEIFPNNPPLISPNAKKILIYGKQLMDEQFCNFLVSLWRMNKAGTDIDRFRPGR